MLLNAGKKHHHVTQTVEINVTTCHSRIIGGQILDISLDLVDPHLLSLEEEAEKQFTFLLVVFRQWTVRHPVWPAARMHRRCFPGKSRLIQSFRQAPPLVSWRETDRSLYE